MEENLSKLAAVLFGLLAFSAWLSWAALFLTEVLTEPLLILTEGEEIVVPADKLLSQKKSWKLRKLGQHPKPKHHPRAID